MNKISILGSGTWGCALARILSIQGNIVIMFSMKIEEIRSLRETHQNKNLPNMILPNNIIFTTDIKEACLNSDFIFIATSSIYVRSLLDKASSYINERQIIVNVSKGIEENTLYTMSTLIHSILQKNPVVVLSGPTHAEEVANNQPTTIVSACDNNNIAIKVAKLFNGSCIRAYTNFDVIGVELSGALKNIIALVTGIAKGLGYGDNIKAAIMTRGMNEISRLGKAMGCFEQTFYGLSGIGDLIVTATSEHSRNNRCGQLIGKGYDVEDAVKEIGQVVEGLNALKPAISLAKRYDINMSIIFSLNKIVNEGKAAKEIIDDLMSKPLKSELDKSDLDIIYENNMLISRRSLNMKRVITYGTFDLLHYGHINLLKRAKALGDYLIVCLSTDEFNLIEKQKTCYFTYEQRKSLLEALRYVDLVIPEKNWNQKKTDVHEYHIDTFVIGDDWKGKFDFLKNEGVDVVYLPRTPEISTTIIKKELNKK